MALDYIGDDPLAFVISANLHRRHLNESQRVLVATRLATLSHGGDRSKAQICALTQDQAADMLNVSRRGVQYGRKVLEHGTPELIHAIEQGKTTVSAACREIKKANARWWRRRRKAKALEAYLRSPELQRPMLCAQRQIEARIGQLLGPAGPVGKRSSHRDEMSLSSLIPHDQDRADFRLLGEALAGKCEIAVPTEWRKSRHALGGEHCRASGSATIVRKG